MDGPPDCHRKLGTKQDNALTSFYGAAGAVLGCVLAFLPTWRVLHSGVSESFQVTWDGCHGKFSVELDALSAFFLLPLVILGPLAAIYAVGYLRAYADKWRGGFWCFFNLFLAGMFLVLIARTALLFLISWEVMSLSAFFLVTFEDERAEVRRAGWIYLIATHLGVAFLIASFALLGYQAGSLDFQDWKNMPPLNAGMSGLVFLLALSGFGAKAGLVPFHVWLPEAHPAAPSPVSALMSGIMIKMGVYGFLRVLTFLGAPAIWWGPLLIVIGLVTALVGISLALSQRDLKRVLAYSSIENIGLIALAFGVGLWGWSNRLPAVAALGFAGGLLHIWNHALIKGLLFFAAGSVLHGTDTKDIERLGGLMKRMPWTSTFMFLGLLAIAALPPLNGFVGKWLMYLGLLQSGLAQADTRGLAALLAVGLMALIGGLAAIGFVRVAGVVLLGSPRSEQASHAQEASPGMLVPMAILLSLCIGLGMAPQWAMELLSSAQGQLLQRAPQECLSAMESSGALLTALGTFHVYVWVAVVLISLGFLVLIRLAPRSQGATWGCGYVSPSARMQYTGRSFSELMAEHLLPRPLRPHLKREAPHGLFPSAAEFAAECPDPLSQEVYEPFFGRWASRFARLRVLQPGGIHVYLVYIMMVVVVALAWVTLQAWWGTL